MTFDLLVSEGIESSGQGLAGNIDPSLLLMMDDSEKRNAQRRQADQKLQKSEERYRAFVEHSSEAVWCMDIDPPCSINLPLADQIEHFYAHGYLAECNDVTARTYGFSVAAEIVGVPMSNLLPRSNPDNHAYLSAFIHSNYRLTDAESQEFDKEGTTSFFLNNLVGIVQDDAIVRAWGTRRDITERRKAENALRESEERYERLVELCPDAIIVHSDEEVTFCNTAAAKLIGASSATDLIGRPVFDFVAGVSRDILRARIIKVLSGELLPAVEFKCLRLDGSHVDVEMQSVFFTSGNRPAIQAVIRDISERKRAEEVQGTLQSERDELLEQLQLQIEFMPLAFILTDTEFRTTYWNPAAERIFGFSKEEVIGLHIQTMLVPPDSQPFVDQILAGVAADGSSISSFNENLTKDGRRICCDWYAAPLKKADGSFIGLMCMAQDVTDRKRAEDVLKEANERALKDYERLVERIAVLGQTLGNARDLNTIFRALRDFALVSVPCDGIIISLYNPEKEVRKLVYCWADKTEMDTENFPEIPVRDGMAGRSIKSGTVVINNHYQEQLRTASTRVLFGKFDDETLPRSALSAPMTVMGRTVGSVEIQSYREDAYEQEHATAIRMAANLAATAVENVTLIEREQATEEQLRQSQKMDAIGQLAGGVAHDFNNLLTVITGYSELGMRRMEPADPMRKNLEQIKKAGDRAASLTRQLLAFSRKQIFQEKVVDLNSIVADMDKMLRRLIGEDIDLVSLLEPSLRPIKADPGQIEQVLLNLAVNARDAMPRGGKLTIETGHATLDESYANSHLTTQPGQFVMLAVSDTGAGMDAETQKRIFEPFFTTKEVGKGTGLGLATVYGVVKQSGGNIWVYSEPGTGTTFKIYLPIAEDSANPEAESTPDEIPQGQGTILLVEDEELVRNLAGEILGTKGYQVLTAANGVEALRVCSEHVGQIDLMVTDVVMPQMGGRELAERIGTVRPEMKVLYMSGYTDDAIVRHGILEDHVAFIQKPFSPDLFALKVREVLEHLPLPDALASNS
jgi:PAS domain S-box-containing protein